MADAQPVAAALRESERSELEEQAGKLLAEHGALVLLEAVEKALDDAAWEHRHLDVGALLKRGANEVSGVCDLFSGIDPLAGKQ